MRKTIYSTEHKELVKRLKKARIEAGLGQVEAAKKLGRTQSYISKLESGQRRIDVIQVRELAEIYRKSPGHFLPK